jgi:RNA polymerase sigma-70 factor (ECF subfamily)
MSAEESSLLSRLLDGDDAAYAQLVNDHGPRLLAVARRFMHEESDAQDAVQDGFRAAFKALPAFKADASLGTWLHAIVVRACLMKLRTKRRRPERSIEDLLPKFHDDGHRADPGAAWSVDDDLLQRRETRELVRTSIDELPETYRTVLMLRDIEGFDTQDTADMLGIETNAVKTRLHRARQALRTLLSPHFEAGGVD